MRLCESVILSTFLYSAESWPLTATSLKRLNGAYHWWQRSILSVSWIDRITNQEPNSTALQALSVKEDYADMVTCCEWTTSTFHSKLYTGRFKASRGDRVGRAQTGEVKSRRIYKNVTHLGEGRGGSCRQIRMVSACGSVRLYGRRMNQASRRTFT